MSNTLYSHRIKRRWKKPLNSKPKAFKSEESANSWAKKNNIKSYTLRNIRKEGERKKIKIVMV
ncbi:hypothetical protein J4458_05030 [Candidatus Woesearchaeota archaeon]|nr:hypothetical protein [Candidatus Woesearchaeota archaeon]